MVTKQGISVTSPANVCCEMLDFSQVLLNIFPDSDNLRLQVLNKMQGLQTKIVQATFSLQASNPAYVPFFPC